MTWFEDVKEFHEKFDVPIKTTTEFPDEERRTLRRALLAEEYKEYLLAEGENDMVEVADALADMVYIICGTALEYGIPLDEVFMEIQRSNLSKLDENGDVVRREDGKVLKSDLFSPPKLERLLLK